MNEMIPILLGWLVGSMQKDAGECMRIDRYELVRFDAFRVHLASGTVLEVRISEIKEE